MNGKGQNNYITETSLQLFGAAEKDLVNIGKLLDSKKYSEELSYEGICWLATQIVEKCIKGYLVQTREDIKKSHNLIYLCNEAVKGDESFKNIYDECDKLNNYTSGMRYDMETTIEKHEVIEVFKLLKNVYEFDILKELRDSFRKNEDIFKKFPDINIQDIIDNMTKIKCT